MTKGLHSVGTPAGLSGDPLKTPAEVSREVNADISASRFAPTDWRGRLAERMTAYTVQQERRRNERAEFAERRNHGLAARHARKLARNRGPAGTADHPGSQQ